MYLVHTSDMSQVPLNDCVNKGYEQYNALIIYIVKH